MASYDFSLMQELAAEEGGEYHETENHVVVHLPGQERLLVGFDNVAWTREEGPRKPWAYDLGRKQGWGIVGVMCKRTDWFRDQALFDILEGMRDRGVFSAYPDVSMYGSSMGAFGACVFSCLAPGCTVVAFSPQSTIAPDIAPFENRYEGALQRADWSQGDYRDAAKNLPAAGKVYIVHDPLEPEDVAHLARLRGANCEVFGWKHLTHKVPPSFKRMGILKPMALEMLDGTMTRPRFFKLLRNRKIAIPYATRLLEEAVEKGHLKLAIAAAERARLYKDNWKIRQTIKDLKEKAEEQGI